MSGLCGLPFSFNKRINYISKTPIIGFFPFPKEDLNVVSFSLEKYIESYDNLIMSVATYFKEGESKCYEHRGILRNPISMLKKDYKNIGLLIHAFAGRVWHLENPDVEFMCVNPDGNSRMRNILAKDFKEDEISTSECPGSNEKLATIRRERKDQVMITIEALEKKFL